MSVEAVSREVVPSSAEGVLLGGASQGLFSAFKTVERVHEIVSEDAERDGLTLTPWQKALRLSEAGDWTARRLASNGLHEAEVTATGILASAAHFYGVQRELRSDAGMRPRSWRSPLTHMASLFNKRIRTYGRHASDAYPEDLLVAMGVSRWLVDPEARVRDSESAFRPTIKGARYELVTDLILRQGGVVRDASIKEGEDIVRETTVEEDLAGIDLVLRSSRKWGIPIDVAASSYAVERKCGTRGQWGIKGGVLVLWCGLTEEELGDGFSINPEVAEAVYNDKVGAIIEQAVGNPDIRRVRW